MSTINTIIKSLFAVLCASVCFCNAASVTVEWDPLTATGGELLPNVTYKVFFGEAPAEYTHVVETAETSTTLDLEYNKTYYFAVKSCIQDVESDYSGAMTWTTRSMKDDDADGISDDWEMLYFNDLNSANAGSDFDEDGISDRIAFIVGKNPTNSLDSPDLEFLKKGTVSFTARPAIGAGYQNRKRIYALQRCTDLAQGDWVDVSGLEQVVATGQVVECDATSSGEMGFYRTKINLE